MESMSSKAISPRNEPVSGRRYILEVSVKNDCRWRRGWSWNWRIRNGENTDRWLPHRHIPHQPLHTRKMCRGCYRETDSMAYLSIQEDREGHVDTHTSYIHTPRRFFSYSSSSFHCLLYISFRIYIKIVLFRRKTCRRNIQTSSSRFKTA